MATNFPYPLPNGWFHVAYADEVAAGALFYSPGLS